MLPSTPFIGDRELNIHRNRFEPRQKTPPTPSSLLVYGNCDTFQGTTRVPPQSNMHLTFMNLSDPLNFYPRLKNAYWREFPSLHWLFNDTRFRGVTRNSTSLKAGSVFNLLFRSGILERSKEDSY